MAPAWIAGMSKKRILIVDDDARISALLGCILRKNGYEVREENRSFAALTAAREFRPHLALLDVDMPGKDGGGIAAELGAAPELSATPVIFVTSLVTMQEGGLRGGCHFLSKPVDIDVLLATVRQVLVRVAA